MCVDDLVCVGAEPLFLLDYVAVGKLDPERDGAARRRRGRGLPAGGLRPARRRDGRAPRGHGPRRLRPGRLRRGRRRARRRCSAPTGSAPATCWWAWPRRACGPTATPWPATSCSERAGRSLDDPAWAGATALARPTSCSGRRSSTPRPCWPRSADRAASTPAPTSPAGGIPGNLARVLPAGCDAVVERASWAVPRIFAEIQRLGAVDDDEMARVFNLGLGMVLVGRRRRRRPRCSRPWPGPGARRR